MEALFSHIASPDEGSRRARYEDPGSRPIGNVQWQNKIARAFGWMVAKDIGRDPGSARALYARAPAGNAQLRQSR